MIIRNDITAETYASIPFAAADLRRLKEAFRVHAPDVELARCYTPPRYNPYDAVVETHAVMDDAPPSTHAIGEAVAKFMVAAIVQPVGIAVIAVIPA
jgi:hypothetical protein